MNKQRANRLPRKLKNILRSTIEDALNKYYLEYSQLETALAFTEEIEGLLPLTDNKEQIKRFLIHKGISQQLADKMYELIEVNFTKALDEEGIKDDVAFRSIILTRTRELLHQSNVEDKKSDVSNVDMSNQLTKLFNNNEKRWKTAHKELTSIKHTLRKLTEANVKLFNTVPDVMYVKWVNEATIDWDGNGKQKHIITAYNNGCDRRYSSSHYVFSDSNIDWNRLRALDRNKKTVFHRVS